MQEKIIINNKTVQIFADECAEKSVDIVYFNGGHEDAGAIWSGLCKACDEAIVKRTVLVVIDVTADWNDALTPWEAPRLFKGAEGFAGNAGEYLNELAEEIIPQCESIITNRLGGAIVINSRSISGYSLAGLFAAWSFFETDKFGRLASMSGSMWFDKFAEFAGQNKLMRVPEKAYFSLGDREKVTRNQRMAQVEDCTASVSEVFKTAGAETIFELNPGGHFNNEVERVVQGLAWILK